MDEEVKRQGGGVKKDSRAHRSPEKTGHTKNDDRTSLSREDLSVRPEAGTLTWKDSYRASLICRHRRNPNEYESRKSEESAASGDCVHHACEQAAQRPTEPYCWKKCALQNER